MYLFRIHIYNISMNAEYLFKVRLYRAVITFLLSNGCRPFRDRLEEKTHTHTKHAKE